MNPRFELPPPDDLRQALAADRALETKQNMILRVLARRSLNRFEAERLGDHCLHSTVALLRAKGHAIYSSWETVQTRFKPVLVKRYYLVRRQSASEDEGA